MNYKLYNEFTVPHAVFENDQFRKLRLSSRYFYCYLAKLKNRFENADGWFWRPMALLSEEMGINLKTLKRAKKDLLAYGFIQVRRGKYKDSNRRAADFYRLLGFQDPPIVQSVTDEHEPENTPIE